MSVVGRRRYGHTSRASHIRVTQLIGERLQFVGRKVIVIPQNVIVRRSTRALNARMRTQIEIEFSWMRDPGVHGGARRDVATATALLLAVGTK